MSTSIEIYSKAGEYLLRKITLQELESWLVSMLPTYLQNPDSSVTELAGLIELGLAEINADIRSERGFRNLLKQHPGIRSISLNSYPITDSIDMTVSSNYLAQPMGFLYSEQSPSWHTELQEASV